MAGLIAYGYGSLPNGENAAKAEEREREDDKKEEGKKGDEQAFPRLDGVYRFTRRTTNVGSENRDVYNYIVFSKRGVAFTIKGDYSPLGTKDFSSSDYYLEQPSGDPGEFHALNVPLKDQPAFILKWIADPEEKQPLSAKYEVTDGAVSFTIKNPGSAFAPAFTISYKGRATDKGIKITETSTEFDGEAKTVDRVYEFVAVR
jgi:hypothetical protein